MNEAELVLALGAGMLAAVNPCGFALLPAYLSLLVLGDGPGTMPAEPVEARIQSRAAAVVRALALTAMMTVGFVAIFGIFGLVISPIASGIQRYLPWVTVVIGLALVAGGIWLLTGRSLPTFGFRAGGPRVGRGLVPMVTFGAAYTMASLTCSIAPFLTLVVASFRSASVLEGLMSFIAYGLGMGLLVGTAAIAVALASSSLINHMRSTGRFVPTLTGILMVCVGAYVGYYGWWEIRVLRGGRTDDPVIEVAAGMQRTVANGVATVGVGWLAVILLIAIAVVAVIGLRRLRLRRRQKV